MARNRELMGSRYIELVSLSLYIIMQRIATGNI